MRTAPLIAAAVALGLAAAVPAAGATRNEHTFKLTLSATKPKRSAGMTLTTDRARYAAPPAGTAPLLVKRMVFALPEGTKINVAAATPCSVAALTAQGAAGCKTGSAIGSGEAVGITGIGLLDPVREAVTVFATKTGMVAYLSGLQTAVLPLKVAANKITADVPRLCLPRLNGQPVPDCSNGEAVLKSFKITIRARTRGSGSKLKRLITTPSSCHGGRWTSRASYAYANGDSERDSAKTTCRRS